MVTRVRLIECDCHADQREEEESTVIARLQRVGGFSIHYVNPGDVNDNSVSYSNVTNYRYSGDETFVSFDGIACDEDTYGQADTVRRSNYRSLMRDFPDFPWVRISYTNTNTLGCFVADLDDEMEELLTGLAEGYALYDESDHSELEQEEIEDSWSSFMRGEMYREFGDTMQLIWDRLGEDTVTALWWACASYDVFGGYPQHRGNEVAWGDRTERARDFRPYLIHAYVSHRAGSSLPAEWDMVQMIQRFKEGRS